MSLHRRTLIQSISALPALEALSFPTQPSFSQKVDGTPEASPVATPVATPSSAVTGMALLEDALLAIAPDELLSRLVDSEVTTLLFPSDTGPIEALEWDDAGDSDLEDAVGGVLMQTDTDSERNFIGPGVYIILRSVDDAAALLANTETRDANRSTIKPVMVAGFPGFSIVATNDVIDPDMAVNAVTLVRVGYALISAFADGPADGSTELRSAGNAVGMLDHLRTVVVLTA